MQLSVHGHPLSKVHGQLSAFGGLPARRPRNGRALAYKPALAERTRGDTQPHWGIPLARSSASLVPECHGRWQSEKDKPNRRRILP